MKLWVVHNNEMWPEDWKVLAICTSREKAEALVGPKVSNIFGGATGNEIVEVESDTLEIDL